ncbi:hypothetical protein Tco_0713811 [Tanacetum coccineum]
MFPLAWAIIDIESESSWTWCLQHVKRTMDKNGHLWLLNVVEAIFPRFEHRLCACHIYANWHFDFRGEKLKVAFYVVAKCANEAQLKKRLDEIDNIQDGAKQTIENRAIQQWCRAYFKTHSKCDSIGNNNTEAWNFVFIAARIVGSEEFWPNSGYGELLPPLPKATPGRPRKVRRKRKFEPKISKTKLSRHGTDMHCEICKSSNHNKRSCSSKPDTPIV